MTDKDKGNPLFYPTKPTEEYPNGKWTDNSDVWKIKEQKCLHENFKEYDVVGISCPCQNVRQGVKMNEKLLKNITFTEISKATTPSNGVFQIICNAYWVVVEHNGKDCIMFWQKYSPQCNSNKEIADDIQKRLYPNGRVVQLDTVYVPWDTSERY